MEKNPIDLRNDSYYFFLIIIILRYNVLYLQEYSLKHNMFLTLLDLENIKVKSFTIFSFFHFKVLFLSHGWLQKSLSY